MLIEIKNGHKRYNKGKPNECHALQGVDFSVEEGEMVALMGKSGAGKSTLLHIIGCLDDLTEGQYILDGEEVGKLSPGKKARLRNRKIGFVLQDFALVSEFSVMDNVILPDYFNRVPLFRARKKAKELLEKVQLGEKPSKPVNQLSGGQKQRVAIARALINDPKVLLADEPTGALDEQTGKAIMELFREINKEGTTVIVVTHDPGVAACCDRTVKLSDGMLL